MGAKFAYYLVVLPLSYLPLPVLYLITDVFFILLITLVPYRKKVVLQNLRKSFPDKSTKEINQIKRKFYRHFCDLLAEGIKNLSISRSELSKRFVVKNPEIMDRFFEDGKHVILVSGHYNNWEWLITSQNFLFPHQALGIGMPMTSKFWDKKINERRQRFGMKVIHSKNFKTAIQENMTSPMAILTLADQSPGDSRKSYWMPFMNQQSAILFGTEQMAHEYDMAVVFFVIRKIKRGFYELELIPITDTPENCPWGEITEKHVRLLENEIRKAPEFWIWSHKRWKREIPADLEELKKEQNEKFNTRFKNN